MPASRKYDDELRERAVRLVFESGRPIAHVARDLGVHRETLRLWVRQAEADAGTRGDRLTTQERERRRPLSARTASSRRPMRSSRPRRCFSPRSSTGPRGGERLHSADELDGEAGGLLRVNSLAESFVDSLTTELISDRVWRTRSQLELAVVEYVGWFNLDRLHEALGDRPPAEFEALYAAQDPSSTISIKNKQTN